MNSGYYSEKEGVYHQEIVHSTKYGRNHEDIADVRKGDWECGCYRLTNDRFGCAHMPR